MKDAIEEFARLHIDDPQKRTEWDKKVPALDYWRFCYGNKVLTLEQSAFYNHFVKNLEHGRKVDLQGEYSYVSLYKDELLRRRKQKGLTRRLVQDANRLVSLYNYDGEDLARLLEEGAKEYAISKVPKGMANYISSAWVGPGRKKTCGRLQTVRGGFYWGSYLRVCEYDLYRKRFQTREKKIRGPVLNDAPAHPVPEGVAYSSIEQMPTATRQSLEAWLEGAEEVKPDALRYYLAGIEFTLLCDSTTRPQERIELLRYLYKMVAEGDIARWLATEAERKAAEVMVRDLIDMVITRFFYEKADEVLPAEYTATLPTYGMFKLVEKLSPLQGSADFVEKAITEVLPYPEGLPEVYRTDYEAQLRRTYASMSPYVYEGRSYPYKLLWEYRPLGSGNGYNPDFDLRYSLEQRPLYKPPFPGGEKLVRLFEAYDEVLGELIAYNDAQSLGATPMQLAAKLPLWCPPEKYPGFSEMMKELGVIPSGGYTLVEAHHLVADLLGVKVPGSAISPIAMAEAEQMLKRLGLKTAYLTSMEVRQGNMLPVFDKDVASIPKRNTILQALYMVMWMLQGDAVKAADMAKVDAWIETSAGKSGWIVAAKGLARWLASRKLMFTRKRKDKAMRFREYGNKRDELQQMLLELVADPADATPKRMKRLADIYLVIGLNPTDIHSDLHRMATMPKATAAKKSARGEAPVDMKVLQTMAADTQKAQEILAEVFEEEESEAPAAAAQEGKDDKLFVVLKELASKEVWSRSEVDALATGHGETSGSLLEKLNDASYDEVDDPVAEDDGDNIYVDADVAHQLLEKWQNR